MDRDLSSITRRYSPVMSAWTDEYAPPTLKALGDQVRSAFGLQAVAIGIKGDESHTYGYHRSRRWIIEAGSGTGDYSNQLFLDKSGDQNWLAALDVSLDAARMKLVSGRLMDAMRAKDPRVAALREFFGTLDGRTVTGWDASRAAFTSADDSHLWHMHLSFYRSRANADHSGVLQVITGGGGSMSDYTPLGAPNSVKINGVVRGDSVLLSDVWSQEMSGTSPYAANSPSQRTAQLGRIEQAGKDIRADIAKVTTGGIDVNVIIQALTVAMGDAVRAAVKEALADLTLKAVQ